MKIRSTLLLIFCFFTISTFGQIAKGNLIIEGGASLQSISTKLENSSASNSDFLVLASPKVTYFISDRFAAGGGIALATIPNSGSNFGINGNARFYLSNEENSAWFLKAELDLLSGSGESQFSGNAGLGWDVFLSPNIALESTMAIGFTDGDSFVNDNSVQFLIGTGLKFFFDRLPEELPEDRNTIIKKGSRYLGLSSGSIVLSRRNNTTVSLINLSPSIGKFVSDRLLYGTLINLTNQSAGNFNRFTAELTPFLRYYLNPAGKKFVPFAEVGGGVSFNYISSDFLPTGNETQTNPIIFGSVGVDYFIRPAVAFEVKANYRFTKQADFLKQSTSGISFGFNFFLDRS